MTMPNAEADRATPASACPGPLPASRAHAERCKACGKCSAYAGLWDAMLTGDARAGSGFPSQPN